MRKFLVVVLMLFASPAFAQKWQTSVLQTRFVNTVSVSSSSTIDEVRLSGTMAALVQIQQPSDPCSPTAPCRSVPVRIIYVAEATGVGQSTGTTYRAVGSASLSTDMFKPARPRHCSLPTLRRWLGSGTWDSLDRTTTCFRKAAKLVSPHPMLSTQAPKTLLSTSSTVAIIGLRPMQVLACGMATGTW